MTEQNLNTPATIPEQPDAKPPLRKSMPVVIALVAILAILGIANVTSLLRGNKKTAPTSALPMRPASPSAQQVSSFETQQQLQAQHDAEEKQRQQELLAAMQQFQNADGTPGPESTNAAPMTKAQRDAIYGGSSNAPQRTSNVSEAQAEAKQRALARERQKLDAINSDTMAIDFARTGEATTGPSQNAPAATVLAERAEAPSSAKSEEVTSAGEAGAHLDRLIDFVQQQGIELEYNERIAPAQGASYGGKIVLLPGQSKAETFATLVHELGHEMLHRADRRTATTKVVRETEAEAIAFIVGKAIGLQTSTASADYIQLYHGNAALLAESLEVIQRTSAVILGALEEPSAEESQSQSDDTSAQTPATQTVTEDAAPEPRRSRRARSETATTEAAA